MADEGRRVLFQPHQNGKEGQRFPYQIRLLSREMNRDEVFAMRYAAYLRDGHIPPDAQERFHDSNDESPGTSQIAAYDGDRCVGTLRVSIRQPNQPLSLLPCAPYYPGLARFKRLSMAEMSRMAVDPAIENMSYRTTTYGALVRAGLLAAAASRVSMLLVATKPDWVPFYKRMLNLDVIGTPANYPPGNILISLLGADIESVLERQRASNAFFSFAPAEVSSMRAALLEDRDSIPTAERAPTHADFR